MQYRRLGRSGVKLSVIGLGSYLTIGHHVDNKVSSQCISKAYDAGVNFYDTANAYNRGEAEKALGRLLVKEYCRDSIVLATKVFAPMGEGPNDRGLSRKHIFEQCHASLRRLQTDYIDLYQCHRYDPNTPLDETIRTMEDLSRQGKILYWGVSEWSAAQIADAQGICRQYGWQLISSNQPRYSLMYRYPEREIYPLCEREDIGQVTFSPLAHGVLSGKYKPGEPIPQGTRASDKTQNSIMMRLYWGDDKLTKVQEAVNLAKEIGITMPQMALAWILRKPIIASIITGATRVEQLEDNLSAADVSLPDDILAKLDQLFPAPDTAPPE